MTRLREWWRKRKEEAARRERLGGYEYAAGQLIKSGASYDVVQRLKEEYESGFSYTNFDKGMRDAVDDWESARYELTTPELVKQLLG